MSLHPSELKLDALAFSALPPAEAAEVSAHATTCASCSARLEELGRLSSRFEAQVLPRGLARLRQDGARKEEARWSWSWLRVALVTVPALAALAFAVLPVTGSPPGDTGPEFQIKGDLTLKAFARREGMVFALEPDTRLRPGDALRFALPPVDGSFLLVVSVDGRGQGNVYFPFGGAESARFDASQGFETPGSIVLDDSPGPERFFALVSETPVESEAILPLLRAVGARGAQAIRAARDLPLSGIQQASILVEKDL